MSRLGSSSAVAVKSSGAPTQLVDKAWDTFLDYIGAHNMRTPLSVAEFEKILRTVDKDGSMSKVKESILYSFQHDSYAWPIVERRGR